MQISKQRVGGGGGQAGQRVAYGLWIPAVENVSGNTQVSRYQKGRTNLDFTEARDSEW